MLQVYFLSVICPAVSGFLLYKDADDTLNFEPAFGFAGKENSLRFVFGIVCAVTGVLTLLSPVEGDIPLIGDIVPAASSLAGGLIFLEEHFHQKDESAARSFFFEILQSKKRAIGIISMIAAAVHFLLPKALFL
ncbi:MAG: hypothetical protein LBG72_07760 [Spirochaetaceae bacterium]|jgi:hypothetical protein|nr:hypothetical protein [Spirochaetaceae bacterium]